MLTHPTLDQLRALRLDGMADAFVELQSQDNARDLSHAEWLALLLDREAVKRDTSRFQTRLRSAKLRHSHDRRILERCSPVSTSEGRQLLSAPGADRR
jgi:DNA replication protein DnaC